MIDKKDEDGLLVEGLKAGEESAFRLLVEKYQTRAFSVAFGYIKDVEGAKDVVQESFIRIYEKIKSFKGDSKFYTWYYRILVNLCLDAMRKSKLTAAFSIFMVGESGNKEYNLNIRESEKEEPEKKYATKVLSRKIENGLDQLSVREKQVFELKHYQGFRIREVADIMEIKEGTVRTLLHRAVHKLKKFLKDGGL
jgi:RNA polymerase sigma-70 factor (ECF subfamily)